MDKSIVPVNQIAVRSSTCYEFSNSNPAEVVEIEDDQVNVVEKQMNDLKLDHQFNEKDVPQIFQDIMKKKKDSLTEIDVHIHEKDCTMVFDDEIEVRLEKKGKFWMISYKNTDKTIKTDNPEKSIIDHLWFVLKNPNIKLNSIRIDLCKNSCSDLNNQISKNIRSQKLDFAKLNTLLQTMPISMSHQFHTLLLVCEGFNEDTFFSLLKSAKPGALEAIMFDISWKKEGNHQKLKDFAATDQWKRVKRITSLGVIPSLKFEDLLHCELFVLTFDKLEPEYVSKAKELFINSTNSESCMLVCQNQDLDVNVYREVLLPNSLSEKRVVTFSIDCIVYAYKLPNSSNCLEVILDECSIRFEKGSN